mmetsp:Transcript_5057/g.13105  ORF Transcript_5057/g.13105 Transcript_5057/m.13105 type:complete len:339 (-) Transcript_5057:66-1082(-)
MPVQVSVVGVGAGGKSLSSARLRAPFSARWSRNERALVLTCVLFTIITAAQMLAAIVANSLALLVDAASMIADVATYCVNLWAECAQTDESAPGIRRAKFRELIVAGTSLAALWGLMLFSCGEAVKALPGALERVARHNAPADAQVNGMIVLTFALLGGTIDAVVLRQFWTAGAGVEAVRAVTTLPDGIGSRVTPVVDKAAADVKVGEPPADETSPAPEPTPPVTRLGGGACAIGWLATCCRTPHHLNMGSALAHVSADSFRSMTTLILSVVILSTDMDSELADLLATLLIGLAITITSLGTTARWAVAIRRLLCRPGPDEPYKQLGSGGTLPLAIYF